MEVNFKEKAKSGLDAPTDVCTDAFNDYFKELVLDTDWEGEDPIGYHKAGISMIKVAKEQVTPPIEIASEEDVEKRLILDCGDFEITGIVDLVLPNAERLKDFKTGKRMWGKNKAPNEVQGFLYPHLIKPTGNGLLIPFDFHVLTYGGKTNKFPVQHSRKAAEYLVRVARRLLKMVADREEPNASTGHFLCSDKYCGWRTRHCPLFS
jgi:hypothetical protein